MGHSPDLYLKFTKTGGVYYGHCDSVAVTGSSTSDHSHFLIVLNAEPDDGDVLIMAVSSSKVEKTLHNRRNEPNETVVVVEEHEYHEFTTKSVIDCNSLHKMQKSEFRKKFGTKLILKAPFPQHLVERVLVGVHASDIISNDVKAVVAKAAAIAIDTVAEEESA